ncbi:endonuclease/exonuclease/phosphatase family protein [Microbacteriaceae bacterium VKM Ac-2855]|nr:endonuclease/exonuclease/phosphatase family protein [Microbacteriaceae bacterium VKM Ac-2855]
MADTPLIGAVPAPGLHVMSYNIRRRMPRAAPGTPDEWKVRKELLLRFLQTEQPSLVGVQEALAHQQSFVTAALGDTYRSVGRGRNADGEGERIPIVYDTRRLELLDWRQLALSATPFKPGARSWGNRIPRILVAARFRDRETRVEFLFVNVHFDHESEPARLESARMIASLAAEDDLPTIVTGDFNAQVGSAPYLELAASGELQDAWLIADEQLTPPWATFNGWGPISLEGKRIDWMLTSPSVAVSVVGVNAVRYDGRSASDHEALQAVLHIERS